MRTPRRHRPAPALTSGILTYLASAATTMFYIVGVILLPLWIVLWLLARRRVRRTPRRSHASAVGLGLHVAAILAPVAAAIAFAIWVNTDLSVYPDGSLRAGGPTYRFVYTPAIIVSVLGVAWVWWRHVVVVGRARQDDAPS